MCTAMDIRVLDLLVIREASRGRRASSRDGEKGEGGGVSRGVTSVLSVL